MVNAVNDKDDGGVDMVIDGTPPGATSRPVLGKNVLLSASLVAAAAVRPLPLLRVLLLLRGTCVVPPREEEEDAGEKAVTRHRHTLAPRDISKEGGGTGGAHEANAAMEEDTVVVAAVAIAVAEPWNGADDANATAESTGVALIFFLQQHKKKKKY